MRENQNTQGSKGQHSQSLLKFNIQVTCCLVLVCLEERSFEIITCNEQSTWVSVTGTYPSVTVRQPWCWWLCSPWRSLMSPGQCQDPECLNWVASPSPASSHPQPACSPAEPFHQDDEGSGASLVWGEAVGAGLFSPERTERGSR